MPANLTYIAALGLLNSGLPSLECSPEGPRPVVWHATSAGAKLSTYHFPQTSTVSKIGPKQVLLLASGDLRQSANQTCWAEQAKMEATLAEAVRQFGYEVVRAHTYDADAGHGFIDSQKKGMAVFKTIDPTAPLIVAESVWQYSHHVLSGLITHRGPILTVANWSGTWPGLVGMLNLNGSLTKAGVKYSTLWSDDFTDELFRTGLKSWLTTGSFVHPISHVTDLSKIKVGKDEAALADALAKQLKTEKAILGVFDEGCMGMFNSIIPDALLNPTGVYKERLSQSALYYETTQVSDADARKVLDWYKAKGLTFKFGSDEKTELTEAQVLTQCKMYVAALRIADDFGCHTIGIQYQQGLKDLLPASDLVEGTLNNTDRPPAFSRDGKRELYAGQPLPHFNEVDECAGIDGLLTYRVHKAMGEPVENTLHDLRWGEPFNVDGREEYVWVFLISGAAPPEHFIGGWKGTSSERQPPMYFRLGGGTLKGNSKPGEIVWSRFYMEDGKLKLDIGRGGVVTLPEAETQRRWQATTPQWPIMHAVTYGISRDQMMAKHKSNHIQCVYASSPEAADRALLVKAKLASELGVPVNVCGSRKDGAAW